MWWGACALVMGFAVLVRLCTGLHPYSAPPSRVPVERWSAHLSPLSNTYFALPVCPFSSLVPSPVPAPNPTRPSTCRSPRDLPHLPPDPHSTQRCSPSSSSSPFIPPAPLSPSLHPLNLTSLSRMHTPPKYGDYEAQRHWMEITLHLPPALWYRNMSGPPNSSHRSLFLLPFPPPAFPPPLPPSRSPHSSVPAPPSTPLPIPSPPLSPFPGMHTPPKYGDYEAQRHWMEITVHLPPALWYRNSTSNDLAWWGLDYPPLTAWQSRMHGWVMHRLCPDAVALGSSRGYESNYRHFRLRPPSQHIISSLPLPTSLALFAPFPLSAPYPPPSHSSLSSFLSATLSLPSPPSLLPSIPTHHAHPTPPPTARRCCAGQCSSQTCSP
ncbi:unnamed protein product [Closterium sp. NIES-65]|nr:unnamed protein product [Closterium sp. NIES-65]